MNAQETHTTGLAGCLTRIAWMAGGNAVLILLSATIVLNRTPLPSYRDAAFWGVVSAVVLLRYIDVRYFHGDTADGHPATMCHWRRYAVVEVVASLLLWLAAHGIVWLRA